MPILLEVAVATLQDAQTAHSAGADRLELSSALELGGLTPSLGTFLAIGEFVPLLIVAMLRPRPGGFVYSEPEFLTLQRDADVLLSHGAAGVVFGFLTPERTIDARRTEFLLKQIGAKQSVFHRAFDVASDPLAALDCLIDLGVTRLLTSGQESSAAAGADLIRRLIERAAGRIEILPGAGISPENAAALVAQTGATQLHGTFSIGREDLAAGVCASQYRVTSRQKIQSIRAALAAKPSG